MYWNRRTPEEVYLDSHPNSTLKEYIDYLSDKKEKARLESIESEKRHKELLDSYVGKCFKIDFNGNSFIYFKLTQPISSSFRETVYGVYSDSNKTYMEIEKDRYINIQWLPFQQEWYGTPSVKSSIISEESFNKIVSICNNMSMLIKEIKDTYE